MKLEDLTKYKFGLLTPLHIVQGEGHTKWLCKCDCGNEVIVQAGNLKDGHTKSCGCLRKGVKPPLSDLTGKTFGRLTVLREAEREPDTPRLWLCECVCGNRKIVPGKHLVDGLVRSCGCLHTDTLIQRNTTHNGSKTRIYRVYKSMIARCYDPNAPKYKNYGGLGVSVCDEWRDSFENFRDWAYANGYDENAPKWKHTCTIDRINPFGNYEPSNCRWADAKTQANNKRTNWKGDR